MWKTSSTALIEQRLYSTSSYRISTLTILASMLLSPKAGFQARLGKANLDLAKILECNDPLLNHNLARRTNQTRILRL